MKNIRKILCLLLTLAMIIPIVSSCGKNNTAEDVKTNYDIEGEFVTKAGTNKFVKVNENSKYVLYVNYYNGQARVEDKQSGITYHTNPENANNDSLASGFNKNALLSVITVVYTTQKSVSMNVGSFLNSVGKKGLQYQDQPDGSVVFKFVFPQDDIAIPVRYWIDDDGFHASVLSKYIEETGTNKVESIDLLPFFGAAYKDQEGYLFVPDGSGALIYNNNNRLTAKTYEKALYGFDNGTSDKISGSAKATSATSENQYMPIFGASVDDYGYLAIVTDGAARGTIKANVSGKYTSYNTVWSKFSYRIVGSVNQTQKDGSDRIANIYEHNMELNHDYTVTYKFLEKGKNTYSDMANLYRDYLIKTNGLESRVVASDKIPFYLNTYGYIVKTKSFLGIPTDTKIATSTIKDVEAMLDILDENDIKNVVLKYDYWSKNSYFDKLPTSASVENKVGSKKEMLSLKERLEQSGGALYLSVDLMNAYKTGNGVSSYSDVLKSVANTVLRQFVLKISDSTIDTRYGAWYLIRPSRLSTYFNKYLKNTQKVGYDTLSFDTIGSYLYSELSSDGTGRNFSLKIIKDLIGSIEERTNGLMVTGANEYVASFASHILDTSFRNSGYDLEDVSIPFYQMVFHGYVSYSIGASNLASEPNIRTLKCIEYGAYPQFTVIKENADEIIGSRVDNIFSPDFNNWSDFMHTQYVQVNEALEDVQNATVKSHEFINNDVVKIVYSNGTTIYVNYGSNDAAVGSITVPATGYYVIKSNGKTVSNVALSD